MKEPRHLARAILPILMIAGLSLCLGCGGDSDPAGPGGAPDASLIGTWDLIAINGLPIVEGVWLRWVFNATTVTITSDMDCTEVIEYRTEGDRLIGVRMISRVGSECFDEEPGDLPQTLGTYSVDEDYLEVTITDPDMEPSTVVLQFERN